MDPGVEHSPSFRLTGVPGSLCFHASVSLCGVDGSDGEQ